MPTNDLSKDYSSLLQDDEPTDVNPLVSEYSSLLSTENNERSGSLRSSLTIGSKRNPDNYAKSKQLANETGLSAEFIERNFDKVNAKQKTNVINADGLLDKSPVTAEFLSNPENSSVAHDDVSILESIERTIKGFGAGVTAGTVGLAESFYRAPATIGRVQNALLSGIGALTGVNKENNPRLIENLNNIFDPFSAISTVTNLVSEKGLEQATVLREDFSKRTERVRAFIELAEKGEQADVAFDKALDGDLTELTEVITDPVAIAGFVGQAVPSLGVAMVSGGSITTLSVVEGLQAASSAVDFEERTGVKISDEEFTQAVAQVGIVNGLLEKYGIDKIIKGSGNLVTRVFKGAFAEGATEALQEFNSNIAEVTTYNPTGSLTEGILPGIIGGAGSGGVLSAFNREQTVIDDLVNFAEESKLQTRESETFRTLVDNVVRRYGQNSNIYVSSNEINDLFDDGSVEKLTPAMKSIQKQLQDVSQSGVDVIIPIADYMAEIATSPLHDKLRQHIRLTPDSLSQAEQSQVDENPELDKFFEGIDNKIQIDNIVRNIQGQLVNTNKMSKKNARVSAQLIGAFVETQAENNSMTPEQVFNLLGVKITTTKQSEPTSQLSDKQDFGDIVLSDEVTVEGTDNNVIVEQSAQKLFNQTTKRKNVVKKIGDCLNA